MPPIGTQWRVVEALAGSGWIVLCMFLINIAFPLIGVYGYNDGSGWVFYDFATISNLIPNVDIFIPMDVIWAFIIFIIVITNLWEVLMAAMKIPMYLNAGRGWWWKGEFGSKKRWRKYRSRRARREESTTRDGYSASNY